MNPISEALDQVEMIDYDGSCLICVAFGYCQFYDVDSHGVQS